MSNIAVKAAAAFGLRWTVRKRPAPLPTTLELSMRKGWIIGGTIGLGAAVIAGAVWFQFATSLFYQGSAHPFPQKVLLAQPSPSGKYVAKIVIDEKTKSIVFAVEGVDGTRFLLDKQLLPAVAYHEPIVSISWVTSETATVVVDHDFGEGNLVFEFNAKNLSFKQKL